MKLKTIGVLCIILVLLSAASFYIYRYNSDKNSSPTMGTKLMDTLPLAKIANITITSNQDMIILKKEKPLWVIKNQFNYPANFSLITDLVTKLKNATVSRSFKATKDAVSRLSLEVRESKSERTATGGVGVKISDQQDNILLHIILGITRRQAVGSGQGSYLMLPQKETIYLVDKEFNNVGKTYYDWMKKDIIHIDKEDIHKITCYQADGTPVYILARPERGKWPALIGTDNKNPLDKSKIDDLITAISPLKITDVVADVEQKGINDFAFNHYFTYHLYSGTVFKIIPGKYPIGQGKAAYLLKVKTLENPAANDRDKTTNHREDLMYNYMHKWIYRIPEWKYQRFITEMEALFETS